MHKVKVMLVLSPAIGLVAIGVHGGGPLRDEVVVVTVQKLVTQLSDGSFLAILEAKFLIIVLVGGKWCSVSFLIYSASSASCMGMSNGCAMAFSLRDTVKPCSQRNKVECTTLCFSAK
jgi:hypothetical protein